MVEAVSDLSRDISAVKEKIVDSNFPYKVDLVAYQDFAESYRKQFESEKILLE